jgi:hypothetical protein
MIEGQSKKIKKLSIDHGSPPLCPQSSKGGWPSHHLLMNGGVLTQV